MLIKLKFILNNMDIILKYFPQLTNKQKDQFLKLQNLYAEWNSKINVISRKDIDELYLRHVLHSLAIAKVIEFKPNSKILDVGTGGGFPGIPLALLFPNTRFHLVDSIGKKIKVVNEIVKELGLKNVTSEHSRAENVKGKFDFIVSRAVTKMDEFVKWTRNKISKNSNHKFKNGILYLKGGDLSEELASFQKAKQYDISSFFEEDFFETKKVVYIQLKVRQKKK